MRWYEFLHQFIWRIIGELGGGKKIIPLSLAVNTHKGLTALLVIGLMVIYNNFSLPAWIYLGLHGSYGVCWIIKHLAFRDRRWDQPVTIGGALFAWIFLATYWIGPWLLISGQSSWETPLWLLSLAIFIYGIGLVLMIGADSQKHFTLAHQPGLITTGLYRRIRHPNYLGEMLVYSSFAMTTGHWMPWVVLFVWWSIFFIPNMLMIEKSISRHPGWPEYKKQSGFIIPKL